ncbi:predicted protein [Thalassiosira pseudonana CCMP1335]|uniref:WAP domain-containing protein n=1 Tax=Thalassiosira pseudonana TaxID=35128 RepID=B5YNQ7_THAPS|nr:predicted protein [Thalassiosira pseudonana CCMP1335]ACI64676.1 predicted protein [Thalassiosira pseudonana CCMP1335]
MKNTIQVIAVISILTATTSTVHASKKLRGGVNRNRKDEGVLEEEDLFWFRKMQGMSIPTPPSSLATPMPTNGGISSMFPTASSTFPTSIGAGIVSSFPTATSGEGTITTSATSSSLSTGATGTGGTGFGMGSTDFATGATATGTGSTGFGMGSTDFATGATGTGSTGFGMGSTDFASGSSTVTASTAASFSTTAGGIMASSTAASFSTPNPDTPAFGCPDAVFVGCTAPDPSNFADECSNVGEACTNGNPGEFCCRDACPRNYCTAKGTMKKLEPLILPLPDDTPTDTVGVRTDTPTEA